MSVTGFKCFVSTRAPIAFIINTMFCRKAHHPSFKINEHSGSQGSVRTLKTVIRPRAFKIYYLGTAVVVGVQSESIVCRHLQPPHSLPDIQLGAWTELYRQTVETGLSIARPKPMLYTTTAVLSSFFRGGTVTVLRHTTVRPSNLPINFCPIRVQPWLVVMYIINMTF